jgi:hypothetical protein
MTNKKIIFGFYDVQNFLNNFNHDSQIDEVIYFDPCSIYTKSEILNFFKKLPHIKLREILLYDWPTVVLYYMMNLNIERSYYPNTSKDPLLCPLLININKPRLDRCMIIDNLAKVNILSNNYYSWLKSEDYPFNYTFKHFDNKVKLLDIEVWDAYKQIPKPISNEYLKKTLWTVALEVCDKEIAFSEKVLWPIFQKRPFICWGSPGINKLIKDLGFDIFDDIIDYTFDEENDLTVRVEKFTEQLIVLNNLDTDKYHKLLLGRVENNFKNLFKIVKNKIKSPNEYVDKELAYLFNEFCKFNNVENYIGKYLNE